ncbi:hypothetical protein PG994_007016 [Apiospora phragmitis]|uniref:Uncharacterized protein n=1 Tax=Apiospora phragmitis TaxID=2905665 RepID=A0ABR1UZK3_9PEZI
MSWMDSWSRPAKSQATPAPYYLLPGGEATPYCHSCGRVIGQRKQPQQNQSQHQQSDKGGAVEVVKYCSSRCRGRKPGKLDREIEGVFVRFLLGKQQQGKADKEETKVDGDAAEAEEGTTAEAEAAAAAAAVEKPKQSSSSKGNKQQQKKIKGDARILVSCSMVEDEMFPQHRDQLHEECSEDNEEEEQGQPGSSSSQERNEEEASSSHQYYHPDTDLLHDPDSYDALPPQPHPHEVDDGDVLARMSVRSGTRVRPPQSVSQVNGSVGGEKGRAERADETAEALRKRLAGQRRAREREMVRCAARRGVAFGFVIAPDEEDEGGHHHGGDEQEGGRKGKKKGSKKKKKRDDCGEGDDNRGETKNKKNRRLCEAVMAGKVVEPSFAKGDWSIRWREE